MRTLIIALLVGGCSIDRQESDWPDQNFQDVGVDSGTAVDAGLGEGPGAGTMQGTWLMLHEGSTCVINDEQLTHAWYIVEIDEIDRVLRESRRLCRVDLSPILGLRVLIPEAVRDSIDFIDVDRGYASSLRVGGSYSSSTEVALWGLDLENPLEDTLPAEATDPRVIDGDNDEQPGVTFEIENSTCRRYQGQRQIIRYDGVFVTPNALEGTSINLTDIKVYGSTEPLCGIAPPVISNDAHSRFKMVRVDGAGGALDLDQDGDGKISCAEAAPAFDEVLTIRSADRANCAR